MGVGYALVNSTRREQIMFRHLPVHTAREIIGNEIAGTVISYYLFRCLGDHVAFVSDTNGEWPFAQDTWADLARYTEVTDLIIDEMIGFGWFEEGERALVLPDEPTLYYRSLTLGWNTERTQFGLPSPPWGFSDHTPE